MQVPKVSGGQGGAHIGGQVADSEQIAENLKLARKIVFHLNFLRKA